MNLYSLVVPAQWRAGYVGAGETKRAFFFDCARCEAKEPDIAGFIGASPAFEDIAVLKGQSPFAKLAMYCAPCWAVVEVEKGGAKP